MNVQRENPSFTITGTMIQPSKSQTIAIYQRDGLSWVAHFRDAGTELIDAATWFRVHANARVLRSCQMGGLAAIEPVTLSPEMVEKIEQLHQQADAERARRFSVATYVRAAVRNAAAKTAFRLRGWSTKVMHRPG